MCGIAGLFSVSGEQIFSPDSLTAMLDPMRRRGPDGDGHYMDRGIALGHLRLSIIDHSGGAQPMIAPQKAAVLTYNGEIYNAPALRLELQELGVAFTTSHSDTEVLLQAYLRWGADCVTRFRGMFAFAIWDSEKEQLFMARDRLGIKPLYYMQAGDLFAFASELKGLLPVKGLSKVINPEAVEDFLTLGYIPDPKTIFTGCYKLPPGHSLTFKRGSDAPHIQQYWDLDFTAQNSDNSEVIEQDLLEELRAAVSCRMIADVPLGAFLSGGVDSSAIVGMMSGLTTQRVNSCSIGVDDPDYDESEQAQKVADLFNTDHSMRLVDPASGLAVAELARIFDEPFADNSAIPTLKVSGAAREKVTVALSGDGGDEVFFGYRRQALHMREHSLRRLLPFWLRRPLFGFLGWAYPKLDFMPRFLRAKTTFQALAMHDSDAYCHSVSKTPESVMNKLRSADFNRKLAGYRTRDLFRTLYNKAPASSEMGRIKYIDFKTFLAGGVLTKVDRTSMYHSLEVRVPLLDHQFVEWANRLPDKLNLSAGRGKYIFKKALEKLLPKEILYRSKKGFSVPIGDWLRADLLTQLKALPTAKALADTGMFDPETLEQLVQEHLSGFKNHDTALWSLIMLNESLSYLLAEK